MKETQHIELKSGFNDETIETLTAFANGCQAYAHNNLIAEAFYLTGDVEKYSSGFRRIREELSFYPTMVLECDEIANGFLATLRYSQQKMANNSPTIVTSGEEELLTLIRKNNRITRKEIAVELGTSINTVKQYIRNLKNKGILIRVGTNRTGHWLVKKIMNKRI